MKISMLWSHEFNSRTLINFSYCWRAVSISFRRVHPTHDQWHLFCFIFGFSLWPSITPPTPPSSATQLPLSVALLLSPLPESLHCHFRCSLFYYRLQLLRSHLNHRRFHLPLCVERRHFRRLQAATTRTMEMRDIVIVSQPAKKLGRRDTVMVISSAFDEIQFCASVCHRRQYQWRRRLFLHHLYLLPSRQNQHWMNSKGKFEAAVDRFENLEIRVGWFLTTGMGSVIQWKKKIPSIK